MSLASLLSTPVTIVRRTNSGSTDIYGNPTQSETLVNTTCSLQQQARATDEVVGEIAETFWDLFLPTGTAIDTSDRVLVANAFYEVVGQPWDAREGSAEVWHVEATVKRVAGAGDTS